MFLVGCVGEQGAPSHQSLEVSVYDSNSSSPLAGTPVILYNSSNKVIATSVTDSSGHASFDVSPGDYYIKVNTTGFNEKRKSVSIGPIETTVVDVGVRKLGECLEKWSCTDWGPCTNGKQTRMCMDVNDCNTTYNKPSEEQACNSLECSANSECDDDNPCTTDSCTDGKCIYSPIKSCTSGDGCCPFGCSYNNDKDCPEADQCSTNTDCNDNNPCTFDSCAGSPKVCIHSTIISCSDNDDCCPSGCSYVDDNDCMPVDKCKLDSDCDDNNACTVDTCSGIPKVCRHSTLTACISGDGCCPSGCNPADDADCRECETDGNCDDGNPCTNDTCVSWVCEHTVSSEGLSCGEGKVCCGGECRRACSSAQDCADWFEDNNESFDSNCTEFSCTDPGNCCYANCIISVSPCGPEDGCCPSNCNSEEDPDCETCTDECDTEGTTQCNGNTLESCGNCDGDSCLEWCNPDDCSDCSCDCGNYSSDQDESAVNCSDGIDNDCDGLIDCDDVDCVSYCGECEPGETKVCDNQEGVCKGSEQTCTHEGDWPGCVYTSINGYESAEATCDDGLDNDCDGLTDCDDPDCSNSPECQEDSSVNFKARCIMTYPPAGGNQCDFYFDNVGEGHVLEPFKVDMKTNGTARPWGLGSITVNLKDETGAGWTKLLRLPLNSSYWTAEGICSKNSGIEKVAKCDSSGEVLEEHVCGEGNDFSVGMEDYLKIKLSVDSLTLSIEDGLMYEYGGFFAGGSQSLDAEMVIPGNSYVMVTCDWLDTGELPLLLEMVVDPDNRILESDESDNVDSLFLTSVGQTNCF